MRILKELDRQRFERCFGDNKSCYEFLAELKWAERYQCVRCAGTVYIKGKQPSSRRCSKCSYDESVTSGTIFHKLKFELRKAIGMLYDIATSKKGANSIWLAERYGVNQKTAWLFRQKVQAAMASSEKYPLQGEVHVDEFEIGTPKAGQQGRSKSEEKIRLVIAVESRDGKAGRAYAKVIQDFSTQSLKPIFDTHIASDAQVVTDGWTSYGPLKEGFPHLRQIPSNKGLNFPMLHTQIRNFKNWLRGVHSFCDKRYFQKYIDEYMFRFNRRNHRGTILDKLLQRCANHPPLTAAMIR